MSLVACIILTFVLALVVWLADSVMKMKQPMLAILTVALSIVIVLAWCRFFEVFKYLSGVHVGGH